MIRIGILLLLLSGCPDSDDPGPDAGCMTAACYAASDAGADAMPVDAPGCEYQCCNPINSVNTCCPTPDVTSCEAP